MLSPTFEIIPNTWSNTENPPKPNKKAHKIILIDIFFVCKLDARLTPLVSSKIPLIRLFEISFGICI